MFRRSRRSFGSSCWPPYAPPARAQVHASPTMLFHVLVLLHLLPSGGHSACVRSLLNTNEEPGKQQGRKFRLEWLSVWRFAAHFYPHRVHVSQHQHPFFFLFFCYLQCSWRRGTPTRSWGAVCCSTGSTLRCSFQGIWRGSVMKRSAITRRRGRSLKTSRKQFSDYIFIFPLLDSLMWKGSTQSDHVHFLLCFICFV